MDSEWWDDIGFKLKKGAPNHIRKQYEEFMKGSDTPELPPLDLHDLPPLPKPKKKPPGR